jgi:hypothetical protein
LYCRSPASRLVTELPPYETFQRRYKSGRPARQVLSAVATQGLAGLVRNTAREPLRPIRNIGQYH